MSTNTYQALCDSVGAYKPYYNYPPATAEQRERLMLLIVKANKNYSSDFSVQSFDDGLHLAADNNNGNGYLLPAEHEVIGLNYADALYALTQKLVQESVLDKEEVKGALVGNTKS